MALVGLVSLQDAMNSSTILRPVFFALKYLILVLILFCMVYLLIKTKETAIAWGGFAVIVLLGLNTARTLATNWVLYAAILAFLGRGQDLKRGARIVLQIMGSVFLLHTVTFLANFFFARDSLEYLAWHGETRYFLYYDHPNNAAKYYVFICMLMIYCNSERIRKRTLLTMSILTVVIYFFTVSEAVFITWILIVLWYFRNRSWMKFFRNQFARYGMIMTAAVSACFAFSMKIPIISNFVLLFDIIGSGRFSNMYRTVQRYGITLFGQRVLLGNYEIVGGYDSIYADNLTLYCMVCLGIVYIIIVCALFYKAADKLLTEEKIYFCMFIIFSLFENRVQGIDAYFTVIIAVNALGRKGQLIQPHVTEASMQSVGNRSIRV